MNTGGRPRVRPDRETFIRLCIDHTAAQIAAKYGVDPQTARGWGALYGCKPKLMKPQTGHRARMEGEQAMVPAKVWELTRTPLSKAQGPLWYYPQLDADLIEHCKSLYPVTSRQ